MLRRKIFAAIGWLMAFVIWTALLCFVDVQCIGPRESSVGLASLNRLFHGMTGVHMDLYVITDWLGLAPVAIGLGFAGLGLAQWIQRKKIRKVDADLDPLIKSQLLYQLS